MANIINVSAGRLLLFGMVLISLAFSGCGKKNDAGMAEAGAGANERIIAASFYPMYVAALNVAGDVPGIRLVNMAPPVAGCLHDYQLTPADAMVMEKADALIVNGGGMEGFLDKAAALNKKLVIVDASAGLGDFGDGGNRHYGSSGGGHHHGNNDSRHHHGDGDYRHSHTGNDAGDNTQAWMSIGTHIRQIENIAGQLSAWDTANAKIYSDNAQKYIADLTTLKETAIRELSSISGNNRKIVISQSGFSNFAREFGLTVAAVIEKEHGAEPGAADIAAVANIIKRAKPKAIFVDNAHPSKASKTVSAETGLPVFELDMVAGKAHGKDPGDERGAYVRAMMNNVLVLKEALE